jgi:hypothetical protein
LIASRAAEDEIALMLVVNERQIECHEKWDVSVRITGTLWVRRRQNDSMGMSKGVGLSFDQSMR